MGKYWQIIKITFEEYFEYRLNFLLWRFRSFVSFLTLYFFWLAIYGTNDIFLGYEKSQMLTYIIGISFFKSIVLGSRSADLAGQIRSGELTKYLLRPVRIVGYWFSKDIADKLLNIVFTVLEIIIFAKTVGVVFYFPKTVVMFSFFVILLLLATSLYFLVSFCLSLTAFWTEDVWATRWLFGIIFLEFFAGTFFPIDVLPKTLQQVIYLTPFPYLVYFPLKVWLSQLSQALIIKSIFICFSWTVFFTYLSRTLWQRGLKKYGSFGG